MKIITIIILSTISFQLFGQIENYSTINANNIKIWSDHTSGIIDPIISKASGGLITNYKEEEHKLLSTIYRSSINVVGYSENNNLTGVTSNYGSSSYYIAPGPITDDLYSTSYNTAWKIYGWEIKNHLDDFNDNQHIDNLPSLNILQWPGKNNPFSKNLQNVTWEGREYAPYFDRNNDGQYNPYDGDYPVLDNNCPLKIPDQMSYSLYNGVFENNFEISKLLYAFNSDDNELLNNTVFVRVSVYSKNSNLTKVKLGLFNDFDLGCVNDDYLGTSLENNTIYTFNKTDFDTLCHSHGSTINNYGLNPPIQSITYLDNNPINSMICYRESSNPALTDPLNISEVYNALSSKWRDGTPLTYGGSGYDPSSNNIITSAYPSSPTDPNGWSMKNSQSPGIDPRMYINVDLGDINKDAITHTNFAYTFHPADLSTDHFSRVDSMLTKIKEVKKLFNDCFDTVAGTQECTSECVWPGDTDKNGIVNNHDLLNLGISMNKAGIQREEISETWQGHLSDEWFDNTFHNVNFKHIDCNGSAEINKTDVDVIETNFFNSNPNFTNWGGYNGKGEELTFEFDKEEYNSLENINAKLFIDTDNAYGFSFSVEYDPSKLLLGGVYLDNFWKISPDQVIRIIRKEPGKLHFAITKTKGSEENLLKERIGTINFISQINIVDTFQTTIRFSNYQKINDAGQILPLTAQEHTIAVNKTLSKKDISKSNFMIYPNPALSQFQIKSDLKIKQINLINHLGVRTRVSSENGCVQLKNFTAGLYLVEIISENGLTGKEKLIVIN